MTTWAIAGLRSPRKSLVYRIRGGRRACLHIWSAVTAQLFMGTAALFFSLLSMPATLAWGVWYTESFGRHGHSNNFSRQEVTSSDDLSTMKWIIWKLTSVANSWLSPTLIFFLLIVTEFRVHAWEPLWHYVGHATNLWSVGNKQRCCDVWVVTWERRA